MIFYWLFPVDLAIVTLQFTQLYQKKIYSVELVPPAFGHLNKAGRILIRYIALKA
jgi:hypothetical protein